MIFHEPVPPYLSGRVRSLGQVTLGLRCPVDLEVERVFLRTAPEGEQTMQPCRRVRPPAGYACQWWQARVRLTTSRLDYRFLVITPQENWWLTADGLVRHVPTDRYDFKLLVEAEQPEWVPDAVFYQVFPDRFATSGQFTQHHPLRRSWGSRPRRATGGHEFFGGDLVGLRERLDHLHELGVNSLYLNPIFTAPSNHRYDVGDYYQVDPGLGGNQALVDLRQALTERGMRLVLDIVPNHCGLTHPWFVAAQADPQAPTADYFTFTRHPDEYECWLGVRSLPRLNYRSQALRETMYQGPQAIIRHWLRPPYQIDGWRVDVANMLARQGRSNLGPKVLRGLRRAIKAESPEAYLLGEHFFDATDQLQGQQLDGAMNYRGFMVPLLHWLSGRDLGAFGGALWGDRQPLSTAALVDQWRAFRAPIPYSVALRQLNLLGSHDTPRLLTMLDADRGLASVAIGLLFSYPGVPSIYYGDELGLTGGRDPENRGPMPWDQAGWDQGYLALWRRWVAWRRRLPALARGSFQVLPQSSGALVFQREYAGGRLVGIALRPGEHPGWLELDGAALADRARLTRLDTGEVDRLDGSRLRLGAGPPGVRLYRVELD